MTPVQYRRPPRLSALVLALQAAWGLSAWALPQGAQVVNGQVGISQPAAGSLQINASHGAIINWQKFSIGAGELARFVQPGSTSAVLNRVVGAEASQLLGQLQANGRVFLINPQGIVIGGGARIDTNSFIASTLNLSDADFLAGRLKFMAGAQAGGISNAGYISAGPGGSIALIAPDISNTGIIHAPDGNILLAAGRQLEITSTDLEGVTFQIQAPTDTVLNLGQLLAENGAVRAFAASLRHSGVIRAERLVQDGDGTIVLAGRDDVTLTAESVTSASGVNGGQVLIQSEQGVARVAGQVLATGASGQGGDVLVLGQRVALDSGALLDASGVAGGGQVRVGGDYQGANAAVQNAERVHVAEGATLRADALGQGDGGRVIVWADEDTRFAGQLSARGGAQGGDGGFAEVSGKRNLEFTGSADLSAPQGAMGDLLLDPLDIVVSNTSGILPSVVDEFGDFAANVATISTTKLSALAANVTLQASRDVYIKDKITLATSGAGLSITAGGASFNAGSIYLEDLGLTRPGGIVTTNGAVTLRALAVSGPGTITTNGGAVDILTSGSLNYSSTITTNGGVVTLASQASSVNGANVNAGAGTINVTGTGVSGGSYTSTGTVNLTATAGGVSVYDINAGVANLNASSSVNAYVDVTDRVNAASTGSSVSINHNGTGALRLGTLSSPSGLYLYSSTGMAQASGGGLSSPYINLYTYGSLTAAGTLAAPLSIASATPTRVNVYDLGAPAHLNFGNTTTVAGLSLEGSVAGVGGSTVTGSSNLTSLSLGTASGALTVAASATGGFNNLLSLSVSDGGINASTINLQGGGGIYLQAAGPVTVGNATTTRASGTGFEVYTQKCSYYAYVACVDSSPINVTGFLNAGTGDVRLQTYDNGDITVTGTLTAGDVHLRAGERYYTAYYPYYPTHVTNNHINLGTVVTSGEFSAYNYGQGNIQVASLAATGGVDVYAGNSYDVDGSLYLGQPSQSTLNQISINLAEPSPPAGSFYVYNEGIGNVTVTGNINRSGYVEVGASAGNVSTAAITSTGSSVSVYAEGGNLTTGHIAAYYDVDLFSTGSITTGNVSSATDAVYADAGTTLTVGNVTSGSGATYGDVSLSSVGDLRFGKITSSGYSSAYYGHVTLTSAAGSVETTASDSTNDITATGNVTISAGTHIGNATFASPLDIQAGTPSTVDLSAGGDIGAVGKAVRVNTTGTLAVTSGNGQFHVAASDGTNELALSAIRLSASAAGVGNGNTATLRSLNLDVDASSDGSTLTIGDPGNAGALEQAAGALNEFSVTATGGSALQFGNVSLTTDGHNQLKLNADNGLTQTGGAIGAGYVQLAGGTGNVTVGNVSSSAVTGNRIDISGADITTGDLSAPALTVTGANLNLGAVTTTGTQRGYPNWVYVARTDSYSYLVDELVLTASGNLNTTGNVGSATSALLTAGADLAVNGGAGTVTAGTTATGYYTDTAKLWAGTASGDTLGAGAVAGHAVDLKAHTLTAGDLSATGTATVLGTALNTGTIAATHVSLTGTSFNTGDVTATGNLTIVSAAGYAPAGVDLTANSANITAAGDISIAQANALTASTVNLTTTNNGNISAYLNDTTSLTINSDRGYLVNVQDTLLNTLNVTAAWDKALGAGSVGAEVHASTPQFTLNGASRQDLVFHVNDNNTIEWDLSASVGSQNDPLPTLHVNYADTSLAAMGNASVTGLRVDTINAAGGSVNLSLASDTEVLSTGVTLGNSVGFNTSVPGSFTLSSGGDIDLSNVVTNGGHISVTSRNGDIVLGTLSTTAAGSAGNVTLTAETGNIDTDAGSIYTASTFSGVTFSQTAYGTVTLNAAQGSVGALGTIGMSYVNTLAVNARDTIDVSVGAGLLSNLNLTTSGSGSGAISVAHANYGGLAITRNGGSLELAALNSANGGSLSLTATDGSIKVKGDIAGVTNLTLDAQAGNVEISGSGVAGARSVAALGTISLNAGQDILVSSGSAASESVAVSAPNVHLDADRDVLITASGAGVSVDASAGTGTQSLRAGRHFSVLGGSAANAAASLTAAVQYQNLTVGGDLTVQGGTGSGAHAKLAQTYASGTYYQSGSVGGHLTVQGGNASSGQGANAYAAFSGGQQSFASVGGAVRVAGGTASGNYGLLSSAFSQSIGTVSGAGGSPTDSIAVLGGTGDGAYARLSAAGSQTLYAGVGSSNPSVSGDITVLGGAGTNATAEVLAGGSQVLGSQTNYCYYGGCYNPTQDVLIQGGTGSGAYAAVRTTSGSQQVYGGGTISVLGSSGSGAYAELVNSGGGQSLGSSSTSSNDATDAILIQAGSAGTARVQATGSQSVHTGGTLQVLGGSGTNMTASLESTGGSQDIGYTYIYSNDPTGSVTVQGGTGSGAAAWVRAATGQTLDTGGSLTLTGGGAGAYADVSTTAGTQTIGNVNAYYYDQTDAITLTAGASAGTYAKLGSGGSQNIYSAGDITVTGGSGSGSGAMLTAASGQNVTTYADLLITGGNNTGTGLNATAIRNETSGNQTLSIGGDLVQTNGTGAADTWIYQKGTGAQTVTVFGNLTLVSPNASASVNSIESFGSSQTVNVGGNITIDNQNNWITYFGAHNGTQTVSADAMTISLAGAQGGAFAGLGTGTGQNQVITLSGDGVTAGTASLGITNLNATTGSRAAINSGGDLTLRVSDSNYDTAGAVTVGSAGGLGKADITAAGSLDFVAGSLTLQGGASAAATAEFNAVNTMNVSTLYGPVQLLAGAAGAATIDPTLLSVVSNGSVLMQAGAASTANTNINAGTFNLAATSGDLTLNNSALATSTITATSFNYTGPGGVTLNGGTITVSSAGSVTVPGLCTNCSTNLIGPFSVSAYTPPPVDFVGLVVGDIITLTDATGAVFDLVVAEDGTITVTSRRVNQCF